MAVSYMVFSGLLAAFSNLCMRKSLDKKGSLRAFLIFQLFFTFLIATSLFPLRNQDYTLNSYTLILSAVCGVSLVGVKLMISRALMVGPAALTFATVNSASIVPSILLALFFGSLLNFKYTFWNLIGSLLVALGLFWATSKEENKFNKKIWIFFSVVAFLFQLLFLLLTQAYALILSHKEIIQSLGFDKFYSQWFVPLVFAYAVIAHTMIYAILEKRIPNKTEAFLGSLGGLFNGGCAFLFMYALEQNSDFQTPLLLPIFTVSLIVSCNLWAQWIYKEKIHWKANGLCLLGIIIGA